MFVKWVKKLPQLHRKYSNAKPFPHIVLDDFLDKQLADKLVHEIPILDKSGWMHYTHINGDKRGITTFERLPQSFKKAISELNSPEFLNFLERLTGIKGLIADPKLEGGGVHQSRCSGFLNIHTDFSSHPHHHNWKRTINIIVYLNPVWEEKWGGSLELWDKNMTKCVNKVVPLQNRCIIFTNNKDSFHGHPEPMTCPKNIQRTSIALYYYTKVKNTLVRGTNYRPRPKDRWLKKKVIALDRNVVWFYYNLKKKTGISDVLATTILKKLFSFRKK